MKTVGSFGCINLCFMKKYDLKWIFFPYSIMFLSESFASDLKISVQKCKCDLDAVQAILI